MGAGRISLMLAATVLATGMSVVVAPTAFADGVKDCADQAAAAGMKAPDAGQACSYAQGGDGADCVSMVKDDASPGINDEAAADTCGKAAPPPPAPTGT